jgi:hypothetical protein
VCQRGAGSKKITRDFFDNIVKHRRSADTARTGGLQLRAGAIATAIRRLFRLCIYAETSA